MTESKINIAVAQGHTDTEVLQILVYQVEGIMNMTTEGRTMVIIDGETTKKIRKLSV